MFNLLPLTTRKVRLHQKHLVLHSVLAPAGWRRSCLHSLILTDLATGIICLMNASSVSFSFTLSLSLVANRVAAMPEITSIVRKVMPSDVGRTITPAAEVGLQLVEEDEESDAQIPRVDEMTDAAESESCCCLIRASLLIRCEAFLGCNPVQLGPEPTTLAPGCTATMNDVIEE